MMRLLVTLVALYGCAGGLGRSKAAAVDDQGMTSDVHREKVGKIVFASEEIRKGDEDPDTFKTKFTLGDPIYGRVYLARSLANEALAALGEGAGANDRYEFAIKVFIDGEEAGIDIGQMEDDWTTYNLVIVRAADDSAAWADTEWFARKLVTKIDEGPHKVKLQLYRSTDGELTGKPLAAGTFKLDGGDDPRAAVKEIQKREKNAGSAREEQDEADKEKELAKGNRWVTFQMPFCDPSMVVRAYGKDDFSACCMSSGGGSWLPKGAILEVCDDAGGSRCRKFGKVSDEPEQTVEYSCKE